MDSEKSEAACPFCREGIKAGAVRCRHCQADIPPKPAHGGVCPFCEEGIHAEAIRCLHCKSDLETGVGTKAFAVRRGRMRIWRQEAPMARARPCPPAYMDGSTMWCLVEETEAYCAYEPCGYV
jgi:predicted amidophosphoribosyltransferase